MAGHPVAQVTVHPDAGTLPRRRECGVCWTVYDPALGDPFAQVPPGTSFEALEEHWCCPNCEAPKHKFLALDDE